VVIKHNSTKFIFASVHLGEDSDIPPVKYSRPQLLSSLQCCGVQKNHCRYLINCPDTSINQEIVQWYSLKGIHHWPIL
jgi:hypothetical protein